MQEGIREASASGTVLAGFPVLDFKATLFDGSYHDVDSSEMAFKIAASMAFKEANKKAGPILLEPIMKVEVTTPKDYLGAINGDLNRRRGQIQSQEDAPGGAVVITAERSRSRKCSATQPICVPRPKAAQRTRWSSRAMKKRRSSVEEEIVAQGHRLRNSQPPKAFSHAYSRNT